MDDAGAPRRTRRAARLPQGRLALGVVGAVAVVAAGLLSPDRLPAAPPRLAAVASPLPADPASLDDGFHHLVVSFPEPAGPPVAGRGAGGGVRLVPVADVDGEVDPAALDAVASTGRILDLRRDPASGGLVAAVETAPAPADPGSPPGDGRGAAIEAVPGTRRVTAVGGGHFAVTTTAERGAYQAALPGATVADDVVLRVFADPLSPYQWHLRNTGTPVAGLTGTAGADVGADGAWTVTEGEGQVVAVVDTGMEVTHPDLAAAIWRNPGETCGNRVDDDANGFVDDCAGWDFANGDANVSDTGTNALGQAVDNRHATHIAGIVAAGRDNGVGLAGLAPRAKVMPLKVSDTTSLYLSTAALAIRYAVDNGADVVNCSFGTTGAPLAAVRPLQDAVRYAADHGVLVVAAAGNDGRNIDADPTYPASFPEDNVVSVGASTNADGPASFSNWGPASVDLFAPGWYIASTLPSSSYGTMSGTSMAAPLVAAAAALVRAGDPALDAAAVKERLVAGSAAVPALAGRSVAGTRLDAGRIVTAVPEPVTFAFTGLGGAVENEPIGAGVVASVAASAVPSAAVAYRATLLTSVDGATFGVSGAEVAGPDGTAVTGDDAAVLLSPPGGYPAAGAGRDLPFGVTLPAGAYALVAEAFDPATDTTIGRPWAAFFAVAAAGGPEAPPPTTGPAPGTTPSGPDPVPTTTPAPTPPTGPAPAIPPGGPAPTSPAVPPPGVAPAPTTVPPGVAPAPTTVPPGVAPAPTTVPPGVVPPGAGPAPTLPAPGGGPTAPAPGGTTPTTAPAAPRPVSPAPPSPSPSPTPTPTPAPAPAPAPATVPPPPTLPPPAPPATDGTLTVTSIGPRYGSTAGGDRLAISGRGFAGTVHVLFGSAPGGAVTVVSPTQLLVSTPARAVAGTVDVRVSTAADSVVLAAAFTYLAPGPAPVGGPSPAAPAPPPTTAAPVVPAPAPPPTTPTTTAPPPAPAPAPTTSPPAPTTSPFRFTFGSAVTTRAGLVLRPVLAPSPLAAYPASGWGGRRCTTASCAGVRL